MLNNVCKRLQVIGVLKKCTVLFNHDEILDQEIYNKNNIVIFQYKINRTSKSHKILVP